MKTVQTVKIEKETDDLQFGWLDEETEEWYAFDDMSEEALVEFCQRKDFRKLLVDAITQYAVQVQETIGKDLADLWKRMDQSGLA